MSHLGHAHEEILVLAAGAELGIETFLYITNYAAAKKQIAGPAFLPMHRSSGGMLRALMKLPLDEPSGRRGFEMRANWSQDAGGRILLTGSKHDLQPTRSGEFIVIDEGDVVSRGMFQRLIASERDVRARLADILRRNRRDRDETLYDRSSRALW